MTRSVCRFVLAAGFALAAFAVVQPASAQPSVIIEASAPPETHGPGAFTMEYDISAGADLPSAVVTTHEDSALPALTGGVTLDAAPLPESQVTSPDPGDLRIQLGTDGSDSLPAGRHVLTFTVTVANGETIDTSSFATITWGDSGSATSYVLHLEVNQPDVYSYRNNIDDEVAVRRASAHSGSFTPETFVQGFKVSNAGWGSPDTEVDLAVPKGLTIVDLRPEYVNDGVRRGPQAASGAVRTAKLDLGPVLHGRFSRIVATIKSTRRASIGAKATIHFDAIVRRGQGMDADPSNNASTATYAIDGAAALTGHIVVPGRPLHVGNRVRVSERIRNGGPNTSVKTAATLTADSHFKVVSFSGRQGSSSSKNEILWRVGRLRSGHTATAVLVLKAVGTATKKHPAQLAMYSYSHNVDPRCPDGCEPAEQSVVIRR